MKLEDLLNLEGAVEPAWCKILGDAGGIAVPEFSDKQDNRTPIYEVKLIGVSETSAKQWRYRGVLVAREWDATLVTRSVTKRFHNSNEQSGMAARVRIEAFHFVDRFDPLLPFHYITFMREQTTIPNHQPEGQFDLREQHHKIKIEIREELLEQLKQE
jgi:hypothetical protein